MTEWYATLFVWVKQPFSAYFHLDILLSVEVAGCKHTADYTILSVLYIPVCSSSTIFPSRSLLDTACIFSINNLPPLAMNE